MSDPLKAIQGYDLIKPEGAYRMGHCGFGTRPWWLLTFSGGTVTIGRRIAPSRYGLNFGN